MSMILYHGEPNGASLVVLATLFETGLDVDRRAIDLLGGERHRLPGLSDTVALDMGVEGEGPVLVVDGEAMTESVFVAQYLDEVGAAGLQPVDAYAHWEMLMWCRRITERCSPAAAWLGCKAHAHAPLAAVDDAGFGAITAAIRSDDLRARWQDVRAGAFPDGATADSETKVTDAAKMIDEKLADGRDWLMGAYSIADLVSYGWMAGMADVVPAAFAGRPHLVAWLARMAARPAVQRALSLASAPQPLHAWAPGPEINRWG